MLYFAVILGIIFCLFWTAQLVFMRLHLNWTNRRIESGKEDEDISVSVIHPIKDLDFEFEKNLQSWMNQNFKGKVEHIFSFQEPDDHAISVVKQFSEKYPETDMKIIVNPVIKGLNGKSSNMIYGAKTAKYDFLMFGDSDIRIKPDFIVKMVRPLIEKKVGMTTCGQINIGGKDFWTRYFTFIQNSETDFIWAFLTKLGMNLGATGAAFAMRREVLEEVGGLEAFGSSLLEDFHLGTKLRRNGYKLVLGPVLECHVDKIPREKSFNYAKRIAIGIRDDILFELPVFIIMLFWYWILFIIALTFGNIQLLNLVFVFMGLRTIDGILQKTVTMNRILPVDFIMPLFFDVFGTFYLLYSFTKSDISWRGIKYEVKKGGFIRETVMDEEMLKEQPAEE